MTLDPKELTDLFKDDCVVMAEDDMRIIDATREELAKYNVPLVVIDPARARNKEYVTKQLEEASLGIKLRDGQRERRREGQRSRLFAFLDVDYSKRSGPKGEEISHDGRDVIKAYDLWSKPSTKSREGDKANENTEFPSIEALFVRTDFDHLVNPKRPDAAFKRVKNFLVYGRAKSGAPYEKDTILMLRDYHKGELEQPLSSGSVPELPGSASRSYRGTTSLGTSGALPKILDQGEK